MHVLAQAATACELHDNKRHPEAPLSGPAYSARLKREAHALAVGQPPRGHAPCCLRRSGAGTGHDCDPCELSSGPGSWSAADPATVGKKACIQAAECCRLQGKLPETVLVAAAWHACCWQQHHAPGCRHDAAPALEQTCRESLPQYLPVGSALIRHCEGREGGTRGDAAGGPRQSGAAGKLGKAAPALLRCCRSDLCRCLCSCMQSRFPRPGCRPAGRVKPFASRCRGAGGKQKRQSSVHTLGRTWAPCSCPSATAGRLRQGSPSAQPAALHCCPSTSEGPPGNPRP